MKRKEAENLFLPIINSGKDIWIIHRVRELPTEMVSIAIRLAALDFIQYVRITDDTITASNEVEGTRIKKPVTDQMHPNAIGISIFFDHKLKMMNFDEINSPIKGNGSKMVDAVLSDFPKDWQASVLMDWSDGFWDKMIDKYKKINWIK
jgi:hypothetical protein